MNNEKNITLEKKEFLKKTLIDKFVTIRNASNKLNIDYQKLVKTINGYYKGSDAQKIIKQIEGLSHE